MHWCNEGRLWLYDEEGLAGICLIMRPVCFAELHVFVVYSVSGGFSFFVICFFWLVQVALHVFVFRSLRGFWADSEPAVAAGGLCIRWVWVIHTYFLRFCCLWNWVELFRGSPSPVFQHLP